jgi:protein-S-isoprenylcysteine O-methyltransferase Ste14
MQFQAADGLLLAGLWLAYFALHSLLASLRVKRSLARRWPKSMRGYRLAFNTLALLLVLPPLWLTYALEASYLWRWSGVWAWVADLLALAALIGVLWSLRYYASGEFLGLRQWRRGERRVEDQEGFYLSPLHRFVRHPWYSLALVIIWTRDMNAPLLIAAGLISLYFVLGSRLEEAKLIEYHGEVYRRYRERVPALLPSPWRHLDARTAQALVAAAGKSETPRK